MFPHSDIRYYNGVCGLPGFGRVLNLGCGGKERVGAMTGWEVGDSI